jgi:tetratricopeptide (TPR) repeat protein
MTHCQLALELVDRSKAKEQHSALLSDHGFEGLYVPGVYLAWAQALTGDVSAARRSLREVGELAERTGDPYVLACVYAFAGVVHHDLGDLDAAGDTASKLLVLCQDKPFPFWQAVGFVVQGGVLMYRGDPDGAVASIQQGNNMYSATGAKTPYPYHRKYLAEAHLVRGDFAKAIETLEEALGMMRTNLDRNFEPEVLRLLGEAQYGCGQLDLARQTLSAALDLCRSQSARLLELKIATSLALMLEREADRAGACRVLTPVAASFGDIGDFEPLRKANEILARVTDGRGR